MQSTRQEKKQQKLLGNDCPEDKPQLCQSYLNPEKGRKCNHWTRKATRSSAQAESRA